MSSEEKKLLLIDTDAGLDDAQAILMALAAPNVTIVGLTTVTGNTNSKQVSRNLLRLLKLVNRLEIPIYTGTDKPLVGVQDFPDPNYHGLDGFGDVYDDSPADIGLLKEKHAVQALIDISKEYKGQITLVALGPLTNIALAIRLDPEFGTRLKSCYIMGGNCKGEGNVSPCAEFNFYKDPEAAYVVLHDLGCPITIACWELCTEYALPWDKYHELRSVNTVKSNFFKKLEEKMYNQCQKDGWTTYIPCDELCMACVLDTSVIAEYNDYYCTVELNRSLARGLMVVDKWGVLKKEPNARIITKIHSKRYETLLRTALE